MKTLVFIFFGLILICACVGEEKSDIQIQENETAKSDVSAEFTVIVVDYKEAGWGYQILQDGKLAIDQKHIPAIQGYRGFDTKEKAEITGNFTVNKMKNGIFPPTISPEELDSLGVL